MAASPSPTCPCDEAHAPAVREEENPAKALPPEELSGAPPSQATAIVMERIAILSAEDWDGVAVAGENSPAAANEEMRADDRARVVKPPFPCQPFMQFVKDVPKFQACMAVSHKIGALDSSEKIFQVTGPYLQTLDQESFSIVSCDIKKYMRNWSEVHLGTRDRVEVSNADVQRYAIAIALFYGARLAVVLHNHPSGVYTPSPKDIELTRELHGAFIRNDILLLDHLVVGLPDEKGKAYFSFMDAGLIPLGRPTL